MHFTDEKKETEDTERRNKEAFIVNDVHNKGYLHLNKRRQLHTALNKSLRLIGVFTLY